MAKGRRGLPAVFANYDYRTLASAVTTSRNRRQQAEERSVTILAEQRNQLGRANSRLDEDLVLGDRVRDRSGKFRIHLFNLDWQRFHKFLPIGVGYSPLCALVRRATCTLSGLAAGGACGQEPRASLPIPGLLLNTIQPPSPWRRSSSAWVRSCGVNARIDLATCSGWLASCPANRVCHA